MSVVWYSRLAYFTQKVRYLERYGVLYFAGDRPPFRD